MATHGSTARAWAISGVIFAAAMMIMLGIWQIIMGIAAIVEDRFFVVASNYTYELDTTAWGWIHLALGVLMLLTGLFLFRGAMWARVVAITLAVLSAIANFFFLPYYPLWAIVTIAVDVFVIWALATTRDFRATDRMGYGEYPEPAGRTRDNRWSAADRTATPADMTATPADMPPATGPTGTPRTMPPGPTGTPRTTP